MFLALKPTTNNGESTKSSEDVVLFETGIRVRRGRVGTSEEEEEEDV